MSKCAEANATLIRYVLEQMDGITNTTGRVVEVRGRYLPYREGASQTFPLMTARMTVNVLEETPDRFIFQARNGAFLSFPRRDVEFNPIVEEKAVNDGSRDVRDF